MKFRPLHDRVLVRRAEAETQTAGGIIIPGTAEEKPQQGEVVAIGTGYINQDGSVRPLDVKVGDIVMLSKWGGDEIVVDGEDLTIIKEEQIMGVVE